MAKLTYPRALEQVERGEVAQGYLLLGEEYYQRFLLIEKIIARKLPAGQRTYNKYSLSGNKANPAALEESLFGVPLLGGDTIVIVSDMERLPQSSQQFLPKALKTLDASVTFIGTAKKLDGRTAFAKALMDVCQVVEIKELYDSNLPAYVQSRFAVRGMTLDEAALKEFCRIVGRDSGDIENEVEKLSISQAGKVKLTIAEVQSHLSNSRFFNQYEVAEHFANKRLRQALLSLEQYLESGGSGAQTTLFWALYNQFERMLLIKMLSSKLSDADLAGKLRIHPFIFKEIKNQAMQQRPEDLVASLLKVYQAEVDDRFSIEPKSQIFERMIITAMARKGE